MFKLKKNSHLRDSMFWYIVIITVFYLGTILIGITR